MALTKVQIESWRPVPGFEGSYEVSNEGRVRSVDRWIENPRRMKKGRMMTPSPQSGGYLRVSLSKDARALTFYVHRLVAAAFIGPCPEGMEVNHLDGDKLNNRPGNLEYVTHLGNVRHAVSTGLINNAGTDSHFSKLNATDVAAIKVLREAGFSGMYLADLFGVTAATIYNAEKGRTYSSLAA